MNTMGVFISLAFLLASIVFYNLTQRAGLSQMQSIVALVTVVLLCPLGASLLSAIEFGHSISKVFIGKSGSSHDGGFILGVLGLIFVARWQKINVLSMLDAAALSWCAGHTVGRLACFFGGDGCYGIPTNSFLGMTFLHGIRPTYIPVYPTPLFESGYSLIIFVVFYYLYSRRESSGFAPPGRIFFGACSWMLLCRFAIEFIRINPKYAGFSLAQWICIPLVIGFSIANFMLPQYNKEMPLSK